MKARRHIYNASNVYSVEDDVQDVDGDGWAKARRRVATAHTVHLANVHADNV